jgi:hypothetical protein
LQLPYRRCAIAAAIPAGIGLGSSLIGGITGKGAAKRQEKLVKELLNLQRPLLQQQAQFGQFALQQSRPFIRGAGQAMQDLQEKFYKPLAFGNRSAIDMFLSPERRAINQGFQSTVSNITRFAPRGGGRVASLVQAEQQKQGQLSDLVFGARRQGAEGLQNVSQQLGALGTGLLGAGFGAGQQGLSQLQNQQQLSQRASERSSDQLGELGESLGGFLGEIFKRKTTASGPGVGGATGKGG